MIPAAYRDGASDALTLYGLASEKQAAIFGAKQPALHVSAIPHDRRLERFKRYLGEKEKEEPTGYGTGIIGGAALGGLPLAALGGLMGGRREGAELAAILGGAGALTGGLVGGLAAHHDKREIGRARELMARKDKRQIEDEMYDRVGDHVIGREQNEDYDRLNNQLILMDLLARS